MCGKAVRIPHAKSGYRSNSAVRIPYFFNFSNRVDLAIRVRAPPSSCFPSGGRARRGCSSAPPAPSREPGRALRFGAALRRRRRKEKSCA